MSSTVTVRDATSADEGAMGRLGAMLVEEHHRFDPERFLAPLPTLRERYGQFLVSQISRPEMVVLVAEREGEVVGYAYAGMEGNDYMALRGPVGVLYDLVVDPAHRRQRVGTALLDAALDALSRTLGRRGWSASTAEKRRRPGDVRRRALSPHDD